MADMDLEDYGVIKQKVLEDDSKKIKDLGYSVSCGFGKLEDKLSIEVRLGPLNESADPINEDLLEKIKQDLTDKYNVPFNVCYVPRIVKYRE